jgi:DNA polymerase elongation subunit (family B)
MFNSLNLEHILFLDIETVPLVSNYEELPENWKPLWDKKFSTIKARDNSMGEDDNSSTQYSRAGIYAEFGKIICISVGFLKKIDGLEQFRLKSFASDDEKKMLEEFAALLNKFSKNIFDKKTNREGMCLCGHNAKEFDFPYISRRMMVHGIPIPTFLDVSGKKPWEIDHLLDTMEMWKFGDYKSYTSLNVLAALFGVPTPKDDIDGSQVYKVYYEEKNLQRIVTYCQKDVLTVFQLLRKFRGEKLIGEGNVVIQ